MTYLCLMEKHIKHHGATIRYADRGDGPVLVFLHGYLLSHEIWREFTLPLERDYRIIAIDLPGHGQSSLAGPVSTMEIMAGCVEAILEQESIGQAAIFGHSMGGYTALALLESRPDLFAAIGLFHSHPNADSKEVRDKRDREVRLIEQGHKNLLFSQSIPNMFATARLSEHHKQLEFCKNLATGMSDEAVIAAILGLKSRPDRSQLLAAASCPCLNIAGRLDNFIPLDAVARQIVLPKDSVLLVAETAGHMGFFEEPETIREGILQFLKSRL